MLSTWFVPSHLLAGHFLTNSAPSQETIRIPKTEIAYWGVATSFRVKRVPNLT
jgi:hypothetical protein